MDHIYNTEKPWFYCFITTLSANAGLVSSITITTYSSLATGHMTGNLLKLATSIVDLNYSSILQILIILMCFFLGASLGGILIPIADFTKGKKYKLTIITQGVLIIIAMVALKLGFKNMRFILPLALGLQNSFTTHYGALVARTTHVTGTITDLGFLLTQKFYNKAYIQYWKLLIRVAMIFSYFIGAISGIILFKVCGYLGLLLSIFIYIFLFFYS